MGDYLRPKTRGELYDALKQNIKCEVVASNESITSVLLETLQICRNDELDFKTYPSKNDGWVIYESVK